MANDYLTVSQSVPLGVRVKNLLTHLKEAEQIADELVNHMNHLEDSGDYSAIATAMALQNSAGIPGTSAEGQVVYNLITGTTTALGDANVVQLLARIDYR